MTGPLRADISSFASTSWNCMLLTGRVSSFICDFKAQAGTSAQKHDLSIDIVD